MSAGTPEVKRFSTIHWLLFGFNFKTCFEMREEMFVIAELRLAYLNKTVQRVTFQVHADIRSRVEEEL